MSRVITELLMKEDMHWTVKEVVKHTGISGSTVFQILQQRLKMHRTAHSGSHII
jgi:DNA-binding IclR family transcriptional regulator